MLLLFALMVINIIHHDSSFYPQGTDSKAKDIDVAVTKTKSEIQGESLENVVQSQKLTSQKEESKKNVNSCPQDFVRVGSTCYYISLTKVKNLNLRSTCYNMLPPVTTSPLQR